MQHLFSSSLATSVFWLTFELSSECLHINLTPLDKAEWRGLVLPIVTRPHRRHSRGVCPHRKRKRGWLINVASEIKTEWKPSLRCEEGLTPVVVYQRFGTPSTSLPLADVCRHASGQSVLRSWISWRQGFAINLLHSQSADRCNNCRDPLFNLLVLPKDRDGEKEKEETRIFIAGRFAAVIPGNSTAEYVIANGFLNFLWILWCALFWIPPDFLCSRRNLYNFALVGRLILTWFPSRPPALERPLRYCNGVNATAWKRHGRLLVAAPYVIRTWTSFEESFHQSEASTSRQS